VEGDDSFKTTENQSRDFETVSCRGGPISRQDRPISIKIVGGHRPPLQFRGQSMNVMMRPDLLAVAEVRIAQTVVESLFHNCRHM
jgi:hypothetical protein